VLLSRAVRPGENLDSSIGLPMESDQGRTVPLREDLVLKKLLARAGRLYHILCVATTKTLAAVKLLEILHTIIRLGHELSELGH
jgi:hypothetical protein